MGKQADRERGRVLLGSLVKSQTPGSNLEETVSTSIYSYNYKTNIYLPGNNNMIIYFSNLTNIIFKKTF